MASSFKTQQPTKDQPPIIFDQEQIIGLSKQTEEMFEKSVRQIYYHGVSLKKLQLFDHQCMDISPNKMNEIVQNHLKQICQRHFLRLDQASYHQLDSQLNTNVLPFKELMYKQQQLINSHSKYEKSSITQKYYQNVQNQKIAQSCLWIIYQHFCSISQSNKQISLLIQIMQQNNQAIYIQLSENKQQYQAIISQSYQSLKQNQLNQMTIRQLVPDNCFIKISDFRELINNISRYSAQNMRKHTRNIQRFIKSLQIGQLSQQLNKNLHSKKQQKKTQFNIDNTIFQCFEDNFLSVMNNKFEKKQSLNQALECYSQQGAQLNLHQYMNMNNFGSDKMEQQQIIEIDDIENRIQEVDMKKSKKKKKKKKKNKKEIIMEKIIERRIQIQQFQITDDKFQQNEQKNQFPQEEKEYQKVIKMFQGLKFNEGQTRIKYYIPSTLLEKWSKFRNDSGV